MKLPKKYLTKNPNVMKREIKKHAHKRDDDPSAYKEWDADYKSRKAGKGKPVETKASKYTKKFKEMYGESEEVQIKKNLRTFEDYIEDDLVFEEILLENPDFDEDFMTSLDEVASSGPVHNALKKKSDKSGFPLSILKKVWDRGYSAWKTGHVPGTTPQQWAHARVNSFIVGGRTTEMSDKALYKQAKENKKKIKK